MTKLMDRRSLLKTAGASAALAGFGLSAPAVHSANEKDRAVSRHCNNDG